MNTERMSSTNYAALYKSVEKSDQTLLMKRYFTTLHAELHTLQREPSNKTAKIRALKLLEGLFYGLETADQTEEIMIIHEFCVRAMQAIRSLN